MLLPEGVSHRRCSHREPGVPGIRLLDGICRKKSNGVDRKGLEIVRHVWNSTSVSFKKYGFGQAGLSKIPTCIQLHMGIPYRLSYSMFSFLGSPKDDHQYLEKWKNLPLNFDPNQPTDPSWQVDEYEQLLGKNDEREAWPLFERASYHLLRYHYYPSSVMTHTSDFEMDDRHMRPGDRIIQRIRLIPGILDVITMNQVKYMVFERRRKGFTVHTTENHLEMGEWTAVVSLQKNNDVSLLLHALSRPGPKMPFWAYPFARPYQRRAHRLGLHNFKEILEQREK